MKNLFAISVIVFFSWLSLTAFVIEQENEIDIPFKKIDRAVGKIWKIEEFEVTKQQVNSEDNCFENGCWLVVRNNDTDIGRVYVGRVNSCNAGGCSIEPVEPSALSFEFFDYFLLADNTGKVLWVKVFNYQATQGHEVMSRGWLNQFKGLTKNERLVFGEDIEAISGATVSASAITTDIQRILACVVEF